MIQPGPSDVPAPCPRCGTTTLHRPDPSGALHCLGCLAASLQQQQLRPQVMPPPIQQQPQVVEVHHKEDGGIVRGTINLAKFVFSLIFLFMIGTCVYVCGSAGNATHHSSSSP